MPRGYTTTVRAAQGSDKPEPTWQFRIKHGATEQEEILARAKLYGIVFTVDGGRRYKIMKVYRDEINRLLAIGKYVEPEGEKES